MLIIQMRTSQIVTVAEVELATGENLAERVEAEIRTAIAEGRIPGSVMRLSVPPVRVKDSTQGDDSSMALFDYSGREVTQRVHDVEIIHQGDAKAYLLIVKETEEKDDEGVVIGSFADEGMAHRIGALWRAGLLD